MRISKIGLVLAFIGLFSTSCGLKRDMSAFFEEGRIEGNTYISDSTGWNMSIPEGWKLSLKMDAEETKEADDIYDRAGVIISPELSTIQLISLEKDTWNIFSASYGAADSVNEDELKKSMMMERSLLPDAFVPSIKLIAIHPIREEVIDSINFLTYTFECLLPSPISKKVYVISYLGIVGDKFFSASINYTNIENQKEMMDAWKNSLFDRSKWKR